MQQEHMEQAHEAAEQAAVMAPNAEDAMPMFECIVFFLWYLGVLWRKKGLLAFFFFLIQISVVSADPRGKAGQRVR